MKWKLQNNSEENGNENEMAQKMLRERTEEKGNS